MAPKYHFPNINKFIMFKYYYIGYPNFIYYLDKFNLSKTFYITSVIQQKYRFQDHFMSFQTLYASTHSYTINVKVSEFQRKKCLQT